jgi:SAM-dependent methyltransferase
LAYFEWHREPGYVGDITRHFTPETKVLDVGCGTGWLASYFENYTGVDGSREAVAEAVQNGRNVLHADVAELPFDDKEFEGAVLKDLLEHVPDPVAVVREVRRVLQPGGKVFASSPDAQRWAWDDYTHRRPFTKKSIRLLFADQGFEVETVGYESVMPGTGIVSGLTRRKRRPRTLAVLTRLPIMRRNVWVLARRPASAPSAADGPSPRS